MISLARLDKFYVFKHHGSIVENCSITPTCLSDHRMVQCCIYLNSIKPRSAYWHFKYK